MQAAARQQQDLTRERYARQAAAQAAAQVAAQASIQAQEGARAASEERYLTIFTIAAQNGYCANSFKNLSRAFRRDEQLWDAIKDRPGPGGMTHFMASVLAWNVERATWLLKRSANVNAQLKDGMTALLLVCAMSGEDIEARRGKQVQATPTRRNTFESYRTKSPNVDPRLTCFASVEYSEEAPPPPPPSGKAANGPPFD
jgi:hypothetical protein